MAKGGAYERAICKALSLWWTEEGRDDVFWRSSTSGGRATVRSRQGRATFGQYGDVQATDPIGQPLIDLCTIELKCGYGKTSIADVLDAPPTAATQQWLKFVEQAEESQRAASAPYWLLITKRDRRDSMIFMPRPFHGLLVRESLVLYSTHWKPCIVFRGEGRHIVGTKFSEFTRTVKPDIIVRAAAKESNR